MTALRRQHSCQPVTFVDFPVPCFKYLFTDEMLPRKCSTFVQCNVKNLFINVKNVHNVQNTVKPNLLYSACFVFSYP